MEYYADIAALKLKNNGAYKLPTRPTNIISGVYIAPYLNTAGCISLSAYTDANGGLIPTSGTKLLTLANGNYVAFIGSTQAASARLRFYLEDGTDIDPVGPSVDIAYPRYAWNTDLYYLTIYRDSDNKVYVAVNPYVIYLDDNNNLKYNIQVGTNAIDITTWLEDNILEDDPYATAPDSTPDGGYGDYDYSGDNIDIPSLPSWSITDSGFVTLYKPSLTQIKSLAQYLWTGIFDLTTYKKIFADPMDCIISLSRVPIDADATGSQVLSVGNISTGLTFNVLSNQFVEVSFTSKNIGLRANGFLDYAPYVKVQLYLPFIGMRALSIDDIAGKTLTLKYQIDLFTGACTAYLKCKTKNSDGNEIESVLYQFTGNVLANIPITQANYSSFIQSVIGAAAKTGSALISGGAAAAGAAAMSSGINVAANIKPDIERSGNMTATGGFLGVKKPYLIVTYPNICKPKNRDKTVAVPSFIGLGIQSDNSNLKLSDFKGLTILHKINVKKIPCTEVERQMIETQLTTEGVIL